MESFFKDRVIKIVKEIPRGETLSYGQVAQMAGSPGAGRAVGNIMKGSNDKKIPCHRVIKTDGSLSGYSGIQGDKKKLLEKEGACIPETI